MTERLGDDIRLELTLRNIDLPPQRVELSVAGLPDGWTYELEGDGKPVTAAMVEPDSSRTLSLKIAPPEDAGTGTYQFEIAGETDGPRLELPATLVLAEAKAATVKVKPKLPALRGSPRSTFDFDVTIDNDSPEQQTFNLLAQGPAGFEVVFKEQFGSQELTSIPIDAGASKVVKVGVKLPQNVAAGQYQVAVQAASPAASAATPLLLDVTGQPTLALAGPEGRLSGEATAGEERTFNFTVRNSGTAPAQTVELGASSPSGWQVAFEPATLDVIAPDDEAQVAVTMTPSDKAIAGDYVVTVRANGEGASDSATFRVTVVTSTMWGVAGLGIIGAAVIVLGMAVTRYGRR
jgi:uncharacterized repeat protein (TIGR01451 family)